MEKHSFHPHIKPWWHVETPSIIGSHIDTSETCRWNEQQEQEDVQVYQLCHAMWINHQWLFICGEISDAVYQASNKNITQSS